MTMFGANYLKGKFFPRHPEKCLNYNKKLNEQTKDIYFRSSFEKIFANWLDLQENIIEWGSEITEIPYVSTIDGKAHRYITDFTFTCKDRDNEVVKWLIEVKPSSQVPKLDEAGNIIFPALKKGKNLTQKRIDNWREYCNVLRKNHDKWTQAERWCRQNGYRFKVITEEELRNRLCK